MSNKEGSSERITTPLLLRRVRDKPVVPETASHMTVVTTGHGMKPEMHDQQEDATR